MTIATFKMQEMVDFYSNLLGVDFVIKEVFGATLYSGELGKLKLLFCPAAVAGNTATQNRHQLDVLVPNLNEILGKLDQYGGEIMGEVSDSAECMSVGVYDPDRNSMVLMQLK